MLTGGTYMSLYSIKKYSKVLAPLQTGTWWRDLFLKNELTPKDILCYPKKGGPF